MDDIKEFKKHHKEKSVSLVESVRLKDREDEDARALARLNERRQVHGLPALKSLEDEDNVSEAEKKIDRARRLPQRSRGYHAGYGGLR
ncbi:MAG: carboxy terminal-processing peptidase, partial [Shewanella fodinae]|nr:carboxy terminal-processing peptidase [Shewanella fodinae]